MTDNTEDKKPGKPKGMGLRGRIFLIVLVLLAVVFLPTTLMLSIGMLPRHCSALDGRKRPRRPCVYDIGHESGRMCALCFLNYGRPAMILKPALISCWIPKQYW